MNEEPPKKELSILSFSLHSARGLVRDPKMRRKVMLMVLGAALLLLLSGVTFLQASLDPSKHPVWFILFWLTCAWLTVTAILLAIFDMLLVRVEHRRAQRMLRTDMTPPEKPGPSRDGN